ncbi:meiosis protein mei2 [Fusarium flagelliforme]|uniref:Meiosis protein mei2 n=1 Tax=Fusarium flagelliforme TaxID=2675880 RepID=A0A395N154_9HYPO|nr:meiosis protein mei2 [Fusarium flagelliforme]
MTNYPLDCHGNVASTASSQGPAPYGRTARLPAKFTTTDQVHSSHPLICLPLLSYSSAEDLQASQTSFLSHFTLPTTPFVGIAREPPPVARYNRRSCKNSFITSCLYTSRYMMFHWRGAGHRDIDEDERHCHISSRDADWLRAGTHDTGENKLWGQEEPLPSPDNQSKMKHSAQNAEHVTSWSRPYETGEDDLWGQEEPFTGPDNQSKMKRSVRHTRYWSR